MKRALPHITIVLSLMTLTFFVIERFNEMMGFMTSKLSQWVFAILAVFALITSLRLIVCDWNADRRARGTAGPPAPAGAAAQAQMAAQEQESVPQAPAHRDDA